MSTEKCVKDEIEIKLDEAENAATSSDIRLSVADVFDRLKAELSNEVVDLCQNES
ncbi:MAG: hypothetical protein IJ766_08275 [Clostridia bacterium]|nr:hypothetical protein [Clostridia bacterium]